MTRRDPLAPESAPARGPRRLIFESGSPGSVCFEAPATEHPGPSLDEMLGGRVRSHPAHLPHVSEVDIARHYAHLASMNFGVDTGTYPLGSCTMKYNPRLAEDACRLEGFSGLHPYQPASSVQGALQLMGSLSAALAEVSGLPGVTLQPAAGAHGALTALMVFRAFHAANGDARRRVIIPDSSHGTNPATVSMCGYEAVTVPSDSQGNVDIRALREALDDDVAALMLTNPNTLGLFDPQIVDICAAVHDAGALAYCDGANLNAIMGLARPGDMGFDAMHINLHKTFATPHGGGGPGAGPVCVTPVLAPFLPGPIPALGQDGRWGLTWPEHSIGRVRSFMGNFGVLVRAYAYILAVGGDGLREASEQAVLSANYVRQGLKDAFELPYDRSCMHEFVLSAGRLRRENGVRALDVAKRLLDHGIHPPTIYFPLIVDEAMMIEPTETEPLEALDSLVSAMLEIAAEAKTDPDILHGAPYTTPVRRLDEGRAAKRPDLRWKPDGE